MVDYAELLRIESAVIEALAEWPGLLPEGVLPPTDWGWVCHTPKSALYDLMVVGRRYSDFTATDRREW